MTSYIDYFTQWEAPPIQTPGYLEVKNMSKGITQSLYDNSTSNYLQDIKFDNINLDDSFDSWNDIFPTTDQTTSSNLGQDVVNTARQFLGSKYQWGGNSPSTGFDCSGLIQYAFKQNGIDLPRTTKDLQNVGTSVDLDNVQVGDLILSSSRGPTGRHIKLVSKIENGQIFTIDAKNKNKGIVEEPLTDTNNIITIRRILNSNYSISSTKSKYTNRTEWKEDLANSYRRAGITNENAIRMLVAQDALESGWGEKAQGRFNYGNITPGSSWKGQIVVGRDKDSNGNPIKQKFRSYNSMDEYTRDKVSFLTRLYDFDQNDSINTFTYKLQGGNRAGRKYAGSKTYISAIKNVYNKLRI